MTSNEIAYEADNIFAKIIAGEIPCHKVYEDEKTLVFMDIAPASKGHCMVVPKAGSRNLLDIDPLDLAAAMVVAQKIARAVMKAFGADGVTLRQNNETAGGQEVFHTHFHIMPRYEGEALGLHGGIQTDHETLAAQAKQIASFIA